MPYSQLLIPLTNYFKKQNLTAACAESCTGGLLSAQLTHRAGSSQWFKAGLVTYANEAKTDILGVSPSLISTYGAVSEEVAHAMVRGVSRIAHAKTAVAITGIAGPQGGSLEKPVGIVCFGFQYQETIQTFTQYFKSTTRTQIRAEACRYALEHWLVFLNQFHDSSLR